MTCNCKEMKNCDDCKKNKHFKNLSKYVEVERSQERVDERVIAQTNNDCKRE